MKMYKIYLYKRLDNNDKYEWNLQNKKGKMTLICSLSCVGSNFVGTIFYL